MPSVVLYGRRWHFSTDIVAIPAFLSGVFHAFWIIIILAWAGAKGAWPGHCASSDGVQYGVMVGGLLGSFAANLVVDALLVYHSTRGSPFEVSKRRWVVPLLYSATVPLGATLAFSVYGAYVCTRLVPDCWPDEQRNAVTNLVQGLVFSTWGFMGVAVFGIAITYNMYPQHHDLSSWEARCECLAGALCCHANLIRRPDGKRAPLSNIAELTAGLLSHCDLDASDITAALFLASAAQNRRRRLRVAKALLPVYKALRSSTAGSTADERSNADDEDRTSCDDASSSSSVNDVPTDRELDRMIAQQTAQRLRQQQQLQQQQQAAAREQASGAGIEAPSQQLQQQRLGRRGKAVSWAQDALERAAAPVVAAQGAAASAEAAPDLQGISLPSVVLQQQQQGEPRQASPPVTLLEAGNRAGSLPLTASNVAMLDQRVALMEEGASPRTDQTQIAAAMVAGDLVSELENELPDKHVDMLDQLATAIESEIEQLGGDQQLPADAVLEVAKTDSLDLSALDLDPDAPTIWFSTSASRVAASRDGMSSRGSRASKSEQGTGAEGEDAPAGGRGKATRGSLAATSPFYTDGGAASQSSGSIASDGSASQPTGGVMHAAAVEAAAALAAGRTSKKREAAEAEAASTTASVAATEAAATALGTAHGGEGAALPAAEAEAPPADDMAAAAVAEAAAAARQDAAGSRSEAETSHQPLDLEQQISVRFPVVITPSEHVEDFRGVLSAATLADIYAGRHEKVPSSVLRDAAHFLRYSYAVYSLQPKIEAPASGLDAACGCACCRGPPNPQEVVFKGLRELERLEDEETVELLHLNCSNRVLAHLPYMICLDHGKRAVVLAIRGTISAADIVTDAIVHPELLDSWLPDAIKQELTQPAYAHAGMVAAAKAIFEDMKERGILQQLVDDEEVGDFVAPEEQRVERGGSAAGSRAPSQYNADTASSAPEAAQYRLPRGSGSAGGVGRGARDGDTPQQVDDGCRTGPRSAVNPGVDSTWQRDGQQGVDKSENSPGRQVGDIMRQKIEDEDWQFIVEGHSLGAGAAALISLKLREVYPGLKCIAYSCPGGLVSKNLAHCMASFTTTVAVGKDAVPRSTVGNLARLMDEMVTALARCKQPKLKVLMFPWWRHRKTAFTELFHSYESIPAESRDMLQQYYNSRQSMGQPLSMYPPGRVLFLRPIKTQQTKEWDAVWIQPEDLIAEGLLISPHMLRDHLCSTAFESLSTAAARSARLEGGGSPELSGEVDARPRVRASSVRRAGPKQQRRQRYQMQGAGSLQQVLIEAS